MLMKSSRDFLERHTQFLSLLLPGLFFIVTLGLMPVRKNFAFDTDEGQELIKAMLYSQGFALYDPIWSDQPPLLTILLSSWFKIFGQSVFSARLLILCFATILVWSFFKTLQIGLGNAPALMGTFLLALSCNFLRLSVSVMIGMPSMALAMLAIYTLILYLNTEIYGVLAISGIALAISLQFKMFTLFFVPLILFVLLADFFKRFKKNKSLFNSLKPNFIWLFSLSCCFFAIGIALNSLQLNSSLKFHISSHLKDVFVRENSFKDIILMFLQDFDYFILAIVGIRILGNKQGWGHQIPLLWLAIATIILLNHKPLWYHHYILLSIPLTWLASYAIALAISSGPEKFPSLSKLRHLAAGLCILCVIAIPIKLTVIQWQNLVFAKQSQEKFEIVQQVLDYKNKTKWLFTDNPIYAFYADLGVPPEIAVLSRKRVASGEVTREYLYNLIAKYQPEQVILERFPEVYEPLRPYLETNYLKIEERGSLRHYVLRRIVEQQEQRSRKLLGLALLPQPKLQEERSPL
jgi:Dolichyl-phosphate-mannose-protein mannosyltransferase